ncbi:hypothetical protein [Telluribacter sp.]|jgi:hypothetical protein|uniref:hypothetical protein n=1 Tax=Telluribacter sp. TaxID=1978767 RepID=UPI002E102A77|nr:hypothetical protein [Telluribacter sp.]
MEKNIKRWAGAALLGLLLTGGSASAQFSLGVQGGIAKSNLTQANNLYGGGVNLRIFPAEHFAVGVAAKTYTDGKDYVVAGQTLSHSGRLTPVTATLDLFLSDGLVRPYLGGDAGMYFSKYDTRFNGNRIAETTRRNHLGAAPRAGIILVTGNVGIQLEGVYHFVFGNKNNSTQVGTADNVNFESTSKFYGVNLGLVFGLGKK